MQLRLTSNDLRNHSTWRFPFSLLQNFSRVSISDPDVYGTMMGWKVNFSPKYCICSNIANRRRSVVFVVSIRYIFLWSDIMHLYLRGTSSTPAQDPQRAVEWLQVWSSQWKLLVRQGGEGRGVITAYIQLIISEESKEQELTYPKLGELSSIL